MNISSIAFTAIVATVLLAGTPASAHSEAGLELAVRAGPAPVHYRDAGRYDRHDHRKWKRYKHRKRHHDSWRRLGRSHDRWHRHNDYRRDRFYFRDHARMHYALGIDLRAFHGHHY